ncbi:hypothetical protein CANINC_001059 [Pichia inconspicua]|uniref:UvrD-like helicase ATP-binding domain-containing protein n=1 Tax=Pichia inconspicua TaxID=52247 RepID=A0A4T0X5S3_9ASCO|nr:hypothetical protein CANINC_001059 [[Candida] inconspicua]
MSLVDKIHSTYTEDDSSFQEQILHDCMTHYTTIKEENGEHMFCSSDSSATIISYLIVVLAGFGVDFSNEQFHQIRKCLDNCTKCLIQYQLKRATIRKNFIVLKGVSYNNVNHTMEAAGLWESNHLYQLISDSIENKLDNENLKILLSKILAECLLNPKLLRLNQKLKTYFDHCHTFLDLAHTKLIEAGLKVYPGLLYLMFCGNDEQKKWSLSKLPYELQSKNSLLNIDYFNSDDINPLFIEEYEIHFFNIQKPDYYSDEKAIDFWTNVIPLIKFTTTDTIKNELIKPFAYSSFREDHKIRILDMYSLFINHIFSYLKTPLPFLLRFLAISLEKFSNDIFELIKPHNYMSFFDMAFNNPYYKVLLNTLNPEVFPSGLLEADTSKKPFFLDLFKWMEVSAHILNDSNNAQFFIAIFGFMADFMKNPNCGKFIGSYVMDNMTKQLTLKHDIYTDKIMIELFYRGSARALINKKCIVVFDAMTVPFLEPKAIQLIKSCIIFDITAYSYYSFKIQSNVDIIEPEFNNDLWNLLQGKVHSNSNLYNSVFESFKDIVRISEVDVPYKRIKMQNDKVNEDHIKKVTLSSTKHNKIISDFAKSVDKVLNKLSEYLTPNQIKLILKSNNTADGFWSLILSPIDAIYESSIALFTESLNVNDRLEAFRECLKINTIVTLDSFRKSLAKFTSQQLFKPTQRMVKVIMDFINALLDPISGVITSSKMELTLELKTSIVEFWIDVWKFLGMVFKNIFDWSLNYERLKATLDKAAAEKITLGLLNFTRDVLDVSVSVLNGLKIIVSIVTSESFKKEEIQLIKETLLKPIILTLGDLFKWLRLSDSALLVRCVSLITDILDIAYDSSVDLNDELITILVKLCLRAKKFNNKMNAEQTGELLLHARKINSELVEKISNELEEEKQKRAVSPEVKSDYQYTSRNTSTISKQQTLGNYLKPYVRETVTPLEAPKRLSKLELAQMKLAEKRKAAVEPAPPRPSGFNRKAKSVDNLNSDSDNDSDEDDTQGTGLFTKDQVVAKMKKSKMALQSLQAPRFNNSAQRNKNMELTQKKKAEELMRLRLNVDMTPLYKTVLSWSYDNDSELPSDYDASQYRPVKDNFESVEDYQKCFEPLLLLECWQSIQRAKQVGSEIPFRMTVGSKTAVDSFYDIYTSVKKELLNDLRRFGDNDLLVLMLVDSLPVDDTDVNVPKHLIRNVSINCFAKVKEIKNTVGAYTDVTLRVAVDGNKLATRLMSGMDIVGLKVNTMTTLEREFSSLKGLQYYDLYNEIIKGKPADLYHIDETKVAALKSVYDVNDSQARAIEGTVRGSGFSLIQGPPGTGKTKTILGVIGYFLTQQTDKIHRVLAPGVNADISTAKLSTGSVDSKRKILICAPSNAAVDTLVLRIKNGIKNSKGDIFKPTVVRLGQSDAINEQVKDLTLEEQVDAQLSKIKNNDDSSTRSELNKCLAERDGLKAKIEAMSDDNPEKNSLEIKLSAVMAKRRELCKKLDEMREQRAVNYRNREIERRNIQFRILNNAQVVCSTLSGSAHDVLAGMSMTFETVVIDEAAQCIELSAIIPLRYGCKKCIMVGDPNQLPPTVLSQKAASFKYEQSLFVRMQNNFKNAVYLLDVQYRMHPEISMFPSKEFYNSRLKDGPNMPALTKRPWHEIQEYGPYRFFNIKGQQAKNERTQSLFNRVECNIILEIVEDLYRRYPAVDWTAKIGIISPYKEQVRLLKKTFVDKYGALITKQIEFNTVDGFQGQEKDIILFSCVRAETSTGVGFLADIRRMNVALTRARASLWIVGSVEVLSSNKTWRDLYQDAESRGLVTKAFSGFTRRLKLKEHTQPRLTELKDDDYSPDLPIKPNASQNNVVTGKKRVLPDSTMRANKIAKSDSFKKMTIQKKTSGQISKDLKFVQNHQDNVPKTTGYLPPRVNGVPEGLVRISNKKKFKIPKGPKK